jgi:hypothetical protein
MSTLNVNTLKVDAVQDTSGNSTLKVNAFQDTSGVGFYPARGWVNFKGTGTVSIRDDERVSSISDNGTGRYTVNFSTNMTSANYAYPAIGRDGGSTGACASLDPSGSPTTSSYRLTTVVPNVRTSDTDYVTSVIHGD